MKGKMILKDGKWFVEYFKDVTTKESSISKPSVTVVSNTTEKVEAPLHPESMKYINELALSTDIIEARILAAPDVEFRLIKHKSLPRIDIYYAKLKFKKDERKIKTKRR